MHFLEFQVLDLMKQVTPETTFQSFSENAEVKDKIDIFLSVILMKWQEQFFNLASQVVNVGFTIGPQPFSKILREGIEQRKLINYFRNGLIFPIQYGDTSHIPD